jgi:hypothetical protein
MNKYTTAKHIRLSLEDSKYESMSMANQQIALQHIGTYIVAKREVKEVGGHKVRLKDENKWIKILDFNPAIIKKDVFEAVQKKLRHTHCDRHDQEYALRGKVFCGCYDHALSRIKKTPIFACEYMKVNNEAPCNKVKIAESELESALFSMIFKQAQLISDGDNFQIDGVLETKLTEQVEY